MDTLFLDFCSHRKLFALVRDGRVVSESALVDHTDEAAVLPAIEALLLKAESSFQEIDRIAAITGPGGFMSQRVGLSVANALSWSLKIPIAGLHLSDLYAARVSGDVLWIHSTKKRLLFIRGLGSFVQEWPTPTLISVEALSSILNTRNSKLLYVGEVLPEQAAVLKVTPLETMNDIGTVLPRVVEQATYASTPLTPWYGRGA